MPDVGLPPVGGLVQITWADLDGERHGTGLARLEPNREWFEPLSKDCPHVAADLVASWCRVLVVPEVELLDRIAAEHRGLTWDQWQRFARLDPDQAESLRILLSGYANAVRGAAIR